jgi:XisH protein
MPAKNLDHDAVIEALAADGWTVTDDPLVVDYGERHLYIDLAAERTGPQPDKRVIYIAVEIQSFLGESAVKNLQDAVGQYSTYQFVLDDEKSDRKLFMAVNEKAYQGILSEPLGVLCLRNARINLLVYDAGTRRVVQWIG